MTTRKTPKKVATASISVEEQKENAKLWAESQGLNVTKSPARKSRKSISAAEEPSTRGRSRTPKRQSKGDETETDAQMVTRSKKEAKATAEKPTRSSSRVRKSKEGNEDASIAMSTASKKETVTRSIGAEKSGGVVKYIPIFLLVLSFAYIINLWRKEITVYLFKSE